MNADSSSSGSDDRDAASWAEETLPLAVRRQLLERQLQELGFRKAGGHGTARHDGAAAQRPPGTHPQADSDSDSGSGSGHGD
jgi:hypothetical protein